MKHDIFVDAKGLACPMPIVRTKKAMNEMDPGLIVEIQSTDQGSTADLKAWAQKAGHEYIGTIEEGTTFKHYLRSGDDTKEERTFAHTIDNEGLKRVINEREALIILDVRERNEFDDYHIPSAVSIPMGELENRMSELDKEKPIYVVCRTGNRSDMAAHLLTKNGYKRVVNVVPGMNKWKEEGGN